MPQTILINFRVNNLLIILYIIYSPSKMFSISLSSDLLLKMEYRVMLYSKEKVLMKKITIDITKIMINF